MKSVLISIQPKWCELIASGKKTVEVRKTRPKLETPFKVYIYCTNGYIEPGSLLFANNGKGKVIGEFVCDAIYELYDELCIYRNGMPFYKPIYVWHISDLEIYDNPKELGEFKTPPCERPESACGNCKYLEVTNTPNAYEFECYRENGVHLTRPPQSWCYVEELE